MLNFFDATILGIVEGITEFLPISSTAHLILTSNFLGIKQNDYLKSFEIIIQFGAIMSVVFLYWKSFLEIETVKRLTVAFIPTDIIGLVFYKIIKQYFLNNVFLVLTMLFLGGVFLIIFERYFKEKKDLKNFEKISYSNCFIIGIFQSIAIIPGISRSAATTIGGLFLGIPRTEIVKFSFPLAVPTMFAATILDLFKNFNSFDSNQFQFLIIGFLFSFITAVISIRWLLNYVKNHNFVSFGIYRIIITLIFLAFFVL